MINLQRVSYVRLGTRDIEGAIRFATDVLGLEVAEVSKGAIYFKSDEREHTLCYFEGDPRDHVGDAPVLRINEVHHSIAMFPTDRSGIQHINHQVESADDVMRSFRFLKERQVRIVFGPGRHPSSSAKFLYFEGPDGMVFEYSSGVKMIADELLYRERQLTFDPAGFCEWGAKPDVAEFRS